ncbi:MAG: hypothetical protein M0Z47_09830 [Actinomycetota bacterium]|nr:hypothetical protein [Actinomycetota bacterium]
MADPDLLLQEAARAIRPSDQLVVSDIPMNDRDDPIGRILGEMTDHLRAHHVAVQPRGAGGAEILERAEPHGFSGAVVRVERTWLSPPERPYPGRR